MSKLTELSIEEFLEDTASELPAPGGGSVSALCGALSCALSAMVGRLTIKKDIDEGLRENLGKHIQNCEKLRDNLTKAINEDTNAFNEVMAAFKLPKATSEEKKKRKNAIQQAFKGAAELPLKTAEMGLEALRYAIVMEKEGNPNAKSDALVAHLTAIASIMGALENVKINLESIKDDKYIRNTEKKIKLILEETNKLVIPFYKRHYM